MNKKRERVFRQCSKCRRVQPHRRRVETVTSGNLRFVYRCVVCSHLTKHEVDTRD